MWRFLLMCLCVTESLALQSPSTDCQPNSLDTSLYCRGSRMLRNALQNLSKSDRPITLVRGLEIVPSAEHKNNVSQPGGDTAGEDESVLGRFSAYLRTHELNVKFSDLLEAAGERDAAPNGVQMSQDEARKKDKGQGMMMAMGMMFGKMMAVLGLGGIGALAMKALGVSMLALMMAAMVGMKSLADKGHESSHSVQYVAEGHGHRHRRRRRSATYDPLHLMYRGQAAAAATKEAAASRSSAQ